MYSWHFQHSLPKSALKKLKRWERAQEGGHSKYFDRGLLLGKKWCSRSQDRCYIQSTQVKSGATPTTHHPPPILYFLPTMGPILGKKFNFLPSLLKLSQSGPCLPRVCGSMCLYSVVSILWQISRYFKILSSTYIYPPYIFRCKSISCPFVLIWFVICRCLSGTASYIHQRLCSLGATLLSCLNFETDDPS